MTEESKEEWMRERLDSWEGRVLTQFRASSASLILDFWGVDDHIGAWIYADRLEVGGLPVGPQVRRSDMDAVVAAYALLSREVTSVDVTGGRLRLDFAEGGQLLVEPQPDSDAWVLTFEQGGNISCEPGGALSIRVD